jgi:hypothetical protein
MLLSMTLIIEQEEALLIVSKKRIYYKLQNRISENLKFKKDFKDAKFYNQYTN